MSSPALCRRCILLLPLLLAGCGGGEDERTGTFQPLRFNYLPPIELNVAAIAIERQYIPSGVAPDVSALDPEPPIDALSAMASDRLKAFGAENRAVFAILDASLTRQGEVITGNMAVLLTIFDAGGTRRGTVEARVNRQQTGHTGPFRSALYELTRAMMDQMNVEFEYQIRRNLKDWLAEPTAPDTPVQQTPLDQPGATPNPESPGRSSP